MEGRDPSNSRIGESWRREARYDLPDLSLSDGPTTGIHQTSRDPSFMRISSASTAQRRGTSSCHQQPFCPTAHPMTVAGADVDDQEG